MQIPHPAVVTRSQSYVPFSLGLVLYSPPFRVNPAPLRPSPVNVPLLFRLPPPSLDCKPQLAVAPFRISRYFGPCQQASGELALPIRRLDWRKSQQSFLLSQFSFNRTTPRPTSPRYFLELSQKKSDDLPSPLARFPRYTRFFLLPSIER